MIISLLPTALNHLLTQEPSVAAKLAVHAGKVACIDAGLICIRLKVEPDGLVRTANDNDTPDVTIRVRLADFPLIAQNRERAVSYVRIEGDADFANGVSQLSRSLRWDAEADLSRIVGDIAAPRLVGGARGAGRYMISMQRKFAENAAEYFLEENPMLMRPQAVEEFAGDVARLRDDVERLAKRIDKLKGRSGL